jgi:hypothetical protein
MSLNSSDAVIAAGAVYGLRHFIGKSQKHAIRSCLKGEEAVWFKDKLLELKELVDSMPKVYEQDGLGENAVVHLHYFTARTDFYITERDVSEAQHQAFGLACVHEEEMGYISIAEIIESGAELDLHWKKQTIAQVKAERMLDNFNWVGSRHHY